MFRQFSAALILCGAAGLVAAGPAVAQTPWPSKVVKFQEVAPGEHPRLLFRKSDLPALRAKAKTPEGEAIINRLRVQLDGAKGDSMPKLPSGQPNTNENAKDGDDANVTVGLYTLSHVAGYGLIYQLTGDKKYADLGRKCMELALKGQRDRDGRYSFRKPDGALRAGPSIGWYALGPAGPRLADGWPASSC
jgi:hypothetical protein